MAYELRQRVGRPGTDAARLGRMGLYIKAAIDAIHRLEKSTPKKLERITAVLRDQGGKIDEEIELAITALSMAAVEISGDPINTNPLYPLELKVRRTRLESVQETLNSALASLYIGDMELNGSSPLSTNGGQGAELRPMPLADAGGAILACLSELTNALGTIGRDAGHKPLPAETGAGFNTVRFADNNLGQSMIMKAHLAGLLTPEESVRIVEFVRSGLAPEVVLVLGREILGECRRLSDAVKTAQRDATHYLLREVLTNCDSALIEHVTNLEANLEKLKGAYSECNWSILSGGDGTTKLEHLRLLLANAASGVLSCLSDRATAMERINWGAADITRLSIQNMIEEAYNAEGYREPTDPNRPAELLSNEAQNELLKNPLSERSSEALFAYGGRINGWALQTVREVKAKMPELPDDLAFRLELELLASDILEHMNGLAQALTEMDRGIDEVATDDHRHILLTGAADAITTVLIDIYSAARMKSNPNWGRDGF